MNMTKDMTKLEALTQLRDKVEADDDFDMLPAFPNLHHRNLFVSAYTGSLDAALALHEAVLPGWRWSLGQNVHHGTEIARVYRVAGDDIEEHAAFGPPARAWLLAIFEALISQETP